MDYHVILIEYGKPTHHWLYHDLETAVEQLKRLLLAYVEVNEVCATIVKAGSCDRDLTCYQLIDNQIIPQDPYSLD